MPLGWSIWPKAFLFAPQAKKILLFAFAKQDPTYLLVAVQCKVVSTLDKKKNQIPPDQAKEGLLAIIRDKRRDDLAAAAISLRPGDLASNYLYIGDCSEFLWFYWPVRLYFNS